MLPGTFTKFSKELNLSLFVPFYKFVRVAGWFFLRPSETRQSLPCHLSNALPVGRAAHRFVHPKLFPVLATTSAEARENLVNSSEARNLFRCQFARKIVNHHLASGRSPKPIHLPHIQRKAEAETARRENKQEAAKPLWCVEKLRLDWRRSSGQA